MNRKKMIELIVYILIVIVGSILLISNHFNDKKIRNDLHSGGVSNVAISVE